MNINDIENFQKFMLENTVDIFAKHPGVQYIVLDEKTKNDQPTGEVAVCYSVLEKKPLDQLTEDELIPKQLIIKNKVYNTDVVITSPISALPCFSLTVSDPASPVKQNYARVRPLSGGVSCISLGSSDATLGLICLDKVDNTIVGLTNAHVACSQGLLHRMPIDYFGYNLLNGIVIQPADTRFNPYGESWTSPTFKKNYIGHIKRTVPIDKRGTSQIDAAIISLSGYDNLIDSSSVNIVGFNQKGPFRWATTEEINSLFVPGHINYASPLFRSGRTSGAFGYPGNSYLCGISAYTLGSSYVGYYITNPYAIRLQGGAGVSFSIYSSELFSDLLFIRTNDSVNTAPSLGGDSGSALFALLSSSVPAASAWKVVGLIFAGGTSGTNQIGLACRIDRISQQLNVGAWNGVMPAFTSSNKYIVTNGNAVQSASAITLSLSGQTYYNIGSALFNPKANIPLGYSTVNLVSTEYNIRQLDYSNNNFEIY